MESKAVSFHGSIRGNKPLALNLKRCRFDQTAGLTVCGSRVSTDSKKKWPEQFGA